MQKGGFLYKHKLLTIVSLLILSLISSCQKEDDVSPLINIQEPSGGVFQVFDTLKVEADISDNEQIKSISVKIIDSKNQQVTPSYTLAISKKSYHLNINYKIDNLYLESGNYFLLVEANDGINTGKDYISISIGAVPKRLEDILIVETENAVSSIYSILNGKKLLKTFSYPYQDFIYNSYAQQYLYLSGEGILTAYDKKELKLQWSVSDLKNPNREYLGQLSYRNKLVCVNAYSGSIRSYNGKGEIVKQANTIDTKGEISQFWFGYQKIMAFKKPYTSDDEKIEELNEETGASVYTYDISFSPERLCFVDEDLCIAFGNKYQKAKACSLSTLYNVVHPFGDFGDRELGDAYKYSSYYYILSLNQEIVEYDLSNDNERILETTQKNVKFYHEELYDKLYFIDGNQILNLSYPAAGSQLFYQNDKTISDLIFVYNK